MAFPDDPLDVAIELFYDDSWHDITADVNTRGKIKITHGRSTTTSTPEPSTCELELNNATSNVDASVSGRYSLLNPESDLYGKLNRNTKLRVRVGDTATSLDLPGREGAYASTPDSAALDITGDIDIAADITPLSWRPVGGDGDDELIVSKWANGDASWALFLTEAGTLKAFWSVDGANSIFDSSTASIPDDGAQRAVRWTLDVDNGAGGNEVKFYTGDSVDGPWTQLGSTKTGGSTTSIYASNAPIEIGAGDGGGSIFSTADQLAGRVHAVKIRDGIGGATVASPDFTSAEPGDTSLTDAQGNVWTVHSAAAAIVDESVRFSGPVSNWPTEADVSGNDVWARIHASGIRRRLGRGDKPLRSSLFRDLVNKDSIVAYWPCETGTDATIFPAAVGGGGLRAAGDVHPGAFSGLVASDTIPTFNVGRLVGDIDPYTGDVSQRIMATINVPSGGVASDAQFLVVRTAGTAETWVLSIKTDGNAYVDAYDENGTNILFGSVIPLDMNGKSGLFWLWLEQNGSDIDWQIGFLAEGSSTGSVGSGTLAGYTYDRFTWVRMGTRNIDLNGLAAGHLGIMNGDVHSGFWDTAKNSLIAWSGESAANRIQRLCEEEGVPLRLVGDPDTSEAMGPQLVGTFLAELDNAEKSDMGVLSDDRDAERLVYRTRTDLHGRAAGLTLDYAAGEITPPFKPVPDDQLTRNDVTVRRPRGSSHRAVLETGPLSVAKVGRYDVAPEVSLDNDNQLPDQAGWRLHAGTINQPRHPKLRVKVAATPSLESEVASLRPGDRAVIENPPNWAGPDDHDQSLVRYVETMSQFEWTFDLSLVPYAYRVAEYGSAVRGPAAAELDAGITSSATSMDIDTTSGPLWSTDAGDYPLDVFVGGERITITAMGAATGTVQTATVTRSVNGVSKSHSAGDAVTLAEPAIRALGRNDSAHDLADGDDVIGQDFPPSVSNDDETNVTGFTNTSYTIGDDEVSHAFQAPTSGRVLVLWTARLESNSSGTRASVTISVETGTEAGEGETVQGVDQGIAIETVDPASGGADSIASWMQYRLVEGLTPGDEYIAAVQHAILGSSSGNADVFYRSLAVIPVP